MFAIHPLQTSKVVRTIAKLCTRCRQTRGAEPRCRNLTKNSIIESGSGWWNTLSILDVPSQSDTLQSDGQAEGPRLICDLITKRTFISAATKDQLKDYFFISVLSPVRTRPLVKLSSDNLCVVSQNLQLSAFNSILLSFICPVLAVKHLKLYPTTKGRYTNSENQEPGKYCPCRTSSFSGNKEQRHSCQQLKIS